MGKLAGTVGCLEKQNDINVMWFPGWIRTSDQPDKGQVCARFYASMSEKLS